MNLITGGSGLIGSRVAMDLLLQEKPVRILIRDHKRTAPVLKLLKWYCEDAEELFSKIEWAIGDITDLGSLEDAFENIKNVYHCAAHVSMRSDEFDQMYKINVGGTANLVNIALQKKINKFCHLSSIAALGDHPEGTLITENTPWKGVKKNNHYGLTKHAAEQEVWRGLEEGLSAVILNPSAVIGPCDWNLSTGQVFKKGAKGIIFYPPGAKNCIDVKDVSDIMIRLMESTISGERFILTHENITVQAFQNQMAQEFGNKPPSIRIGKTGMKMIYFLERFLSLIIGRTPEFTPDLIDALCSSPHYSADKIRRTLNCSFIPIKDSIKETIRIYKQDQLS